MGSFTKKEQIVILVLVLIVSISLGFKYVLKDIIKPKDQISENIEEIDSVKDEIEEIEESPIILVHISGQVYNPGIYQLVKGDRVNDAVNLAGGLTKNADLDRINLAKKVADEEKIYIPEVGEEIAHEVNSINAIALTESTTNSNNGIININTCSKSELESLPGIGTVTADKIIEYRNDNPFKSIEEIMNVSGIGDKKFEGIKNLIIVK